MTGQGRRTLPLLLAWLAASLILTLATLPAIAALRFPDADDALRLQQVRDWLAGQSWFDVTQYRIAPPDGVPMHWSRLVDVPIAAVILLLRPFLGTAQAELGALVAVPLLTLGAVMALAFAITRRLIDEKAALLASFLVPVLGPVAQQLRPLRIDHHGWQMAIALGMVLAVFDTRQRRSGILVGALAALWLGISLEGLPIVAATIGLLALRWALDERQAERFVAATASLALSSLALFALTKDVAAWSAVWCDAVSPVHLGLFAFGAAGSLAVVTAGRRLPLTGRLAALALLGGLAIGMVLLLAPSCAAGPFSQLDPLVRDFWYERVREGLPLWRQRPDEAVLTVAFPIIGLLGSWQAWRAADEEARANWATLGLMLLFALLAAVAVRRAGGVANLFALPGGVYLFARALARARAIPGLPLRLAATAASLLIVAPGQAFTIGYTLVPGRVTSGGSRQPGQSCLAPGELEVLNRLPAGDVAAPLDMGPAILTRTGHRVIASAHHRNVEGIRDSIRLFVGPVAEAREIIGRRSVDYVVACPGMAEPILYSAYGPEGFWVQISSDRAPEWLEPVDLGEASPLRAWRVVPKG